MNENHSNPMTMTTFSNAGSFVKTIGRTGYVDEIVFEHFAGAGEIRLIVFSKSDVLTFLRNTMHALLTDSAKMIADAEDITFMLASVDELNEAITAILAAVDADYFYLHENE